MYRSSEDEKKTKGEKKTSPLSIFSVGKK